MNSKLEKVIIEYLEFSEIDRNLSQNTIRMYHLYLHDFLDWSKAYLKNDNIELKDINIDLIKKYRIYLNRRKSEKFNQEFKRSTQKTFLVALRAFLKYLIVERGLEILPPEQIILGKSEESIPKVLNEEQLERLFEVQDLNKVSGLRDRAILFTLFSTGLRVSELCSLNKDSINLETKEFTVIGKGRKARIVYLSDNAANSLRRYLSTRNDSYNPLFIRYYGKLMEEGDLEGESLRLTPRSVQRLVKKYVNRAGISVDATPHTLRHSFATDLISKGAGLREVQELLGHSNVSTTQIYTHVTNPQLKDVHKKYHSNIGSADNPPEDSKENNRKESESVGSIV